jgi:nucleotide-binding universal stress UspA family protein
MRALQYAILLAKHNALALEIVYAHEPPIVYGELAVYTSEERAKELQRRHSEDVLKPATDIAKASGVAFSSQTLIGDFATSIAACAANSGCDGIVMGTRGMSALGNLVMGSVATKVIHLTKLPVTLVK